MQFSEKLQFYYIAMARYKHLSGRRLPGTLLSFPAFQFRDNKISPTVAYTNLHSTFAGLALSRLNIQTK